MKNRLSSKIINTILLCVFFVACSSDYTEKFEIQKTETGINPDEWVKITAGKFFKGRHAHEATIDSDFEIMLTHVTNSQYAKFLNSALSDKKISINDTAILGYYPGDKFSGYIHEIEITDGYKLLMPIGEPGMHIKFANTKFLVDKGYGNHPAIMITWFGAKAYAEFYGWRLPYENEWEKAARGTDKRAFPWGNEFSKQMANFYGNRHKIEESIKNYNRTTPVGFFNGKKYGEFETKKSVSPYGLYEIGRAHV